MPEAAEVIAKVETCFRAIRETRMEGVPILNPSLDVALLGLRPWENHWLATLLTPWFMNLILIPEPQDEERIAAGTKRRFQFPSGAFEFIRGEEPEIGAYWMCSLFSPVFEFLDQETAEICALAALEALFEEAEAPSASEAGMQAVWRGELPQTRPVANEAEAVEAEDDTMAEQSASSDAAPKSFSRRSLITGNLMKEVQDGA